MSKEVKRHPHSTPAEAFCQTISSWPERPWRWKGHSLSYGDVVAGSLESAGITNVLANGLSSKQRATPYTVERAEAAVFRILGVALVLRVVS